MRTRWLIAPAVALALVLGGGLLAESDPPAVDAPATAALPELPAMPAEPGPLYGIVYPHGVAGTGELARLDPRTLRPVRGVPRLPMRSSDATTEYVMATSPDRELAITGNEGDTLTLIDLRRMRRLGSFSAERHVGWSLASSWVNPDRVLLVAVLGQSLVATIVDVPSRRVVSQRVHDVPAGRQPATAQPVSGGVLVRLQPSDGVAAAGLAYVSAADGRVRWATLDRIRAGTRFVEETSRQVEPGMAVDVAGSRAFVVSAGSPVAEVSLPDLAVTYHRLSEPPGRSRSLLGWLGSAFTAPRAEAKLVDGPVRQAAWLGNHYLAVWGEDLDSRAVEGGFAVRSRAYGLRLIDTRTWTIRTLVANATQASLSGNRLLAFGGSYGSVDGAMTNVDAPGLRILAPGGGRPLSAFEGRHLAWVDTYGNYAYVRLDDLKQTEEQEPGFSVVDVRTGKVIGTQRGWELPLLLR